MLVPTILLLTASFEYLEVADLDDERRAVLRRPTWTKSDGICVNVEDSTIASYFSDDTFLGAQGYYLGLEHPASSSCSRASRDGRRAS